MKKFVFTIGYLIPLLFFASKVPSQSIPDFLVNEHACPDGSEQTKPDMSGDGNGNYVVVWEDYRLGNYSNDIFAQIYVAGGIPQGVNFKVNDEPGGSFHYYPCVAADRQMNFVVAWSDGRESYNGDIYAQRFSADGTPAGPNFKVNDDACDVGQSYPSVACDSAGNFVVVWADNRNGNLDIYTQRFSPDGITTGSNFKVNTDNGDNHQHLPHCACSNDGSFIIVWSDDHGTWDEDIMAQRYASDGTPAGENFQVNSDIQDARHVQPNVITDAAGGFKIAWMDKRNSPLWDIYFQPYDNNGYPTGDNVPVGGNPPGTLLWHSKIAGDPTGNFVICWEDNRNDYNDIYARQYTYDCTPVSDCFRVNDDSTNLAQDDPCVLLNDNGDFTLAWGDYRLGAGDIIRQSYGSDGSPLGENQKLNDDMGSENQEYPALAVDGNGTMIFAWADERDYHSVIYAQRISGIGTPLDENFRVVDDSLDETYTLQPSVAADENGNFVIAWADFRNGYCFDIFAQRFDADATPLGDNFQVSFAGGCMHYYPIVSYKENGNFMIVWADGDEGGAGKEVFPDQDNSIPGKVYKGTEPDIYAQLFLSDGTPLGDNFMVNEETGYTAQNYPCLAVDNDGNFIIAWQDDRNGPYHVYLQRFQFDGTPIGINVPVEDDMYLTSQLCPSVSIDAQGNFAVAWMDNRNGNYDIYCRRFLNDGSSAAESFQVNTDTAVIAQQLPRISHANDGKFIVSWTNGDVGYHDIFAQRFWNDGTPDSTNFMIPNAGEWDQQNQDIRIKNDLIYSVWQDNRGGQHGHDIWANVLPWDLSSGIDSPTAPGFTDNFELNQNYPNPFSKLTTISLNLKEAGAVQLNIYDLQGRQVVSKTYEFQETGIHALEIEASEMQRGIYLYRIIRGSNISEARKMVITK